MHTQYIHNTCTVHVNTLMYPHAHTHMNIHFRKHVNTSSHMYNTRSAHAHVQYMYIPMHILTCKHTQTRTHRRIYTHTHPIHTHIYWRPYLHSKTDTYVCQRTDRFPSQNLEFHIVESSKEILSHFRSCATRPTRLHVGPSVRPINDFRSFVVSILSHPKSFFHASCQPESSWVFLSPPELLRVTLSHPKSFFCHSSCQLKLSRVLF